MYRGICAAFCVAILSQSLPAQPNAGENRKPESEVDPALRAYYAGNGLLNRGVYDATIAEYRSFLADHADHEKAPVARYGLVVGLYRLNRCDEVFTELKSLGDVKDFAFAAEVGMMEGQCLLGKEQFAKAAEVFDSIGRHSGESELGDDAASASCEAWYRAGDFETAAKRCQAVASRWPENPLLARSEFFRALTEMARKNYEEASGVLLAYEKRFPKGEFAGQVPLLLAQCYQRGNDSDKAMERYAAVVKAGDPKQMPDALLGLGSLLYRTGKLAEAGMTLDSLIAKFPDSSAAPPALMLRAHVWFAQDDFEKALQAFGRAAKASTDVEAEAAYWMAKCELRRGDFSAAAKRLAAALDQFPQHALQTEMAYDRALALVRAGDSQAALKALSAFLARYLKHALRPDALLLAAGCEQQVGEYGRSLLLCDQFLKEFPTHVRRAAMEFMAAENEMLDKHMSEAASRYRAFLKDFPEDEQADVAKLHLATALYQLEEFDEAARYFEAVAPKAGSDERFRQALLALGDIAFQRGEWKNAEKWLGEYLAADAAAPNADDALMKLAYARQKQDRADEALRDYDRLIEKYPQSTHHVQALFERGQLLAGRKQNAEAEESFKNALAIGPESRFAGPILNQLATLAARRGDHEDAARLFGEAASKSGDDGETAVLRQGQALIAAGKLVEAETAFGQVKSPEGAARRAITLARQDRPKEAVAEIARVDLTRLPPELRESVLYEKAWALRSLENNAEAAGAYREIIAEPESGPLRLHAMLELAELEATDKQYESAAKTLRELRELLAKQSDANPHLAIQSLYRLGVCEFELGRFAEAGDLFAQFVKEFPESDLIASSLFFAGEANFRAGRFDRCAKFLTRVLDEHAKADCAGPAMLRLGECHASLQQWALSEEVFQRFLERFPDSEQWFQAQFGVGWGRENQKRYDEAIASYEKVTGRHQGPTAARAQFQIGQCLFAQKKFEPAVRELLKVDILYAYPEWSAAALYEAGRCFMLMNDSVQARQQFTTVTEKFKDTQWAKLAGEQLAELSASSSLPGK